MYAVEEFPVESELRLVELVGVKCGLTRTCETSLMLNVLPVREQR